MRATLFLLGVLVLLVPEVLRVYYIMPFPGSQEDMPSDTRQVEITYWLHFNIWWIRLIGLVLVVGPFLNYLRTGSRAKKGIALLAVVVCGAVIYAFNFQFMADKMFLPLGEKQLHAASPADRAAKDLVVVVERNNDARAYPISILGYHHQVQDTVGGEAVLITYCTVCRTGRAWLPTVDGKPESFRLVGMDHFNAMFEDVTTKSWWRQVSGECIAGPLKGSRLEEVFSQQMSLAEFTKLHGSGLVLQPDEQFKEQYADLDGFDDGTIDSSLEYRDSASWAMKSWVVGVVHKGLARAYDWNDLVAMRTVTDTLAGDSITVQLASDNATFEVSRKPDLLSSMEPVHLPAYQEFWHSWRTFQPGTTRYVR